MSKTYSSIRGTCDFGPSQSLLFNTIAAKTRGIFRLFGYEEIILPLLEETGLFVRGVGETSDIVEKQMFKVSDKDIVLRPEGTAQVVRYYLENSLQNQSDFYKFCYVGPMFRGERPQKGRLRQFHHLGAEAIGSRSFRLDAEIIWMAVRILDDIGVTEKEVKVNTLGCAQDKQKFAGAIQIGLNAARSQLCEDCQRRLDKNPLRVIDCKNHGCKSVVASLNLGDDHLCAGCKEHFTQVLSVLDKLGIKYTHAKDLVRGLDYYTNTVFEITSSRLGSQDAIGAGGRYDGLIASLGGPQIPAIGFALGMERIILALGQEPVMPGVSVFVAPMSDDLSGEAVTILQKLRQVGVDADMDYCGKSLKSQLRFAQRKNAKLVVILGDEEWKEQCVILKDMRNNSQDKIKLEFLLDEIDIKL